MQLSALSVNVKACIWEVGAVDMGKEKRKKVMKKHDPGSEAARGTELPFLIFLFHSFISFTGRRSWALGKVERMKE